jgi:hypothetical protein
VNSVDLYRKALRSRRVEMMSEVVVRLSTQPDCEFLVESLLNRIDLLTSDRTAQEKMKGILHE